MNVFKLSVLGTLFCGFLNMNLAYIRNCTGACNLQFRCNPYGRNIIWTISEGTCRVFQNSCLLGSLNCQRENQCLQPLLLTSQDQCMTYCPGHCPSGGPQVCASFSYVDSNGVNGDRQMTFLSRCHLNQYACKNANAYIGEPSNGPCP
ncbi:salivary glue protein Sgs-5-like [Drosophila biarmipes]|uniref:salivary glue protein Sgs-5-like n=1 Tax=Drosophila biarmipes TaxID=125945 RepID=UPI0021CCB7C6|nr:salivary glue protein Sgs-5-like [Drosophila biarmipes]